MYTTHDLVESLEIAIENWLLRAGYPIDLVGGKPTAIYMFGCKIFSLISHSGKISELLTGTWHGTLSYLD